MKPPYYQSGAVILTTQYQYTSHASKKSNQVHRNRHTIRIHLEKGWPSNMKQQGKGGILKSYLWGPDDTKPDKCLHSDSSLTNLTPEGLWINHVKLAKKTTYYFLNMTTLLSSWRSPITQCRQTGRRRNHDSFWFIWYQSKNLYQI